MAYDTKTHEIHNKFIDDFHKNRIAFLVLNGKVNLLKNSTMSHLEWFKSLGGKSEGFNEIIRGYFFGDNLVFYKGNFEYDDKFIENVKNICKQVCDSINLKNCKIYCGLVQIKNERGFFPPDKFIGELKNGNLTLI